MALHEQSTGSTDEWYTPAHVFEALALHFDSDPTPGPEWTAARRWCAAHGVWRGVVWLNPPFGGRGAIEPWLSRFFEHGRGVALTPDRTSAPWWQTWAPQADAVLFVAPKLRFIGEDGQPGASPAQGTSLLALGPCSVAALIRAQTAGLGRLFIPWQASRHAAARQRMRREADDLALEAKRITERRRYLNESFAALEARERET